MQKRSQHNLKHKSVHEIEFAFRIILKFWKKSSIHEEISLRESECISISEFVRAIKEKYDIKSAHCLEEIWVIQLGKNYDREIAWIKQVNGRIKLEVPQKYKDFLVRMANQNGKKPFEDPKF